MSSCGADGELMSESEEVTTVVQRHIKPGHDKDYDQWFEKLLKVLKTFPRFRGITVVVPGAKEQGIRLVIYRFSDRESMDKWESSPERKELFSELEKYATQVFAPQATGLETWFKLPNSPFVVPPPKWKMAAVTLLASATISLVSRLILTSYLIHLPLVVSTIIYSAILVLALTYFAMPYLSRVLRRWLYPSTR